MRLSTSYEVLTGTLSNIASVVEDSLSSEEMRNVVFACTEDTLLMIGINQLITYRKKIELGDFRVVFEDTDKKNEDGMFYFQLNSKELTGFLSSFKGMRKTKPSDVIFETKNDGLKIALTVVEDSLSDAEVKNTSVWVFDNPQINRATFAELSRKLPADDANWSPVQTKSILCYVANMLPVMTSEGNSTLYNILTFGEDFVVAFNQRFNTLMQNVLPEEFKGISLNYRAVSFMKSVICNSDMVYVSKTETQLVFKTDDSEAFVKFLTRLPAYKAFVESYKEDHGIVIDRQYFKDVLKRLALVNENITLVIDASKGNISVSNTKFHQSIPITQSKGMEEMGEIRLKVRPQVFQQAIIGDDSQFGDDLCVYFVKGDNGGYTTIFTDFSKSWMSLAVLR